MKPGLQDNDVEMYSTFNERKSVFARSLIKTLKSKIYKYFFTNEYMTVVSKMCILMNQLTQLINTTMHVIAQSK